MIILILTRVRCCAWAIPYLDFCSFAQIFSISIFVHFTIKVCFKTLCLSLQACLLPFLTSLLFYEYYKGIIYILLHYTPLLLIGEHFHSKHFSCCILPNLYSNTLNSLTHHNLPFHVPLGMHQYFVFLYQHH